MRTGTGTRPPRTQTTDATRPPRTGTATHPRATDANGDPCLLTDIDCMEGNRATGQSTRPPQTRTRPITTPGTGRCDPGCEDGQVCMIDRESSGASTGLRWTCVDRPTRPTGDPSSRCDPDCADGQVCRPSFGASTGVMWTCVDPPTGRTTRDPTATRPTRTPPRTPNLDRCDPGCEDDQICVPDRENSDNTGMVWTCVDRPTSNPGDRCDPDCADGQVCRPSFGASTGLVFSCVDRPTGRSTRPPQTTQEAITTPVADATPTTAEEETTTQVAQLTTINPEDGCPR